MEKKAIYPGSFDPITNGHVDIIQRGCRLFPRILIAVLENPRKQTLFSAAERVEIIRDIFRDKPQIEVRSFSGLLIDFARDQQADAVIRGLRAVSDFEYELQMALMNKKLAPGLETLFMMPSFRYIFLSSSVIKEVASLGGNISDLVPPLVAARLDEKFRASGRSSPKDGERP
jgi:pantetheine-phosphate adenylyltransferase